MHTLRFAVQRNWAGNSIDLHLFAKDGDKLSVVKNIIMEDVSFGTFAPHSDPIHLSPENAQLLMDELWNVGIRPSDNRDITEILKANNAHIADLRKVAFDLLGKVIKDD